MVTPTSNPLGYLGIDAPNPRDTFYRRRIPTVTDLRPYKIGDRWIDTVTSSAYILVSKTNTSALWEPIGGGSTQVQTLTGTFGGGPISPLAGNIDLDGISGITFTGAGNTITANNLRDFGPFVVSPIPGESQYSSIQAALNAAAGTSAVVWVLPGSYAENIVMPSLVCLVGLGTSTVRHQVQIAGSVTLNASSTKCMIVGISIISPIFAVQTTAGTPDCSFYECNLSGASQGVNATHAGGSNLIFVQSQVTGVTQGIDMASGHNITLFQGVAQGTDAVRSAGSGTYRGRLTQHIGRISLNDTSRAFLKFSIVSSGATSSVALNNAGTIADIVMTELASNAASTFPVSGIGTLRKSNVTVSGTATVVDPGLTVLTYPIL